MFNGIVYIGRLERRGNQAMDTWRSVLSENAFLFVGDLNNFAKVCFIYIFLFFYFIIIIIIFYF